MFDFGHACITDKSILVQMLRKADLLSKATDALTGSVQDHHSNPVALALANINNDPGSLWRLPVDSEGRGGDDAAQ